MRLSRIIYPAVAAVAVLLVLVLGFYAFLVVSGSPTRYSDQFDELVMPDGWKLAHIEIRAAGVDGCSGIDVICPWVTRYYLVDADPADLFDATKAMMVEAGYQLGETTNCTGGGIRKMTCHVQANREPDHFRVVILDRGEREQYRRDRTWVYIGQPGMSVVRVTAGSKYSG